MLIGTVNSSLSNVGEDRRLWRTTGKSAPIEDHASLGERERDQIWSDLKRERNGNKKLKEINWKINMLGEILFIRGFWFCFY
jgi:hypothetical protein